MTTATLSKREQLQGETLQEVHNLLKKHNKCAVIRPTGWGKTHLFSQLIKGYQKVLYIYPSESVLKMVAATLKKDGIRIGKTNQPTSPNQEGVTITPMTFTRLSRVVDIDLEILKASYFDLVVIDELHRGGADKTSEALEVLIPHWTKRGTHVIGGTATPLRVDGYDVIKKFFNDIAVSKYTLQDSIDAGLLQMPIYSFSVFNKEAILEPIKRALSKMNVDKQERYLDKLKPLEYTISEKLNAHEVIKRAVGLAYEKPTYLKFIVFLPNIDMVTNEMDTVVGYFKDAFPDLPNISTLTIHSKQGYKKNVHLLDTLKPEHGKIDLIFAVNMLNEGYHVDSLTGVVMLRQTKSHIINTQQIGRAFNVMSGKRPIIIDLVDNFNTPYLFTNLRGNEEDKNEGSKTLSVLPDYELSRERVTLLDNVTSTFDLLNKLSLEITTDVEQQVCQLWFNYCQHLPKNQIKDLIKAQGGGITSRQVKEILIDYGLITESQSQTL